MREYKVIKDTNTRDLERTVNRHIADGWALQGGIFLREDESGYMYFQAIVKESKNEQTN